MPEQTLKIVDHKITLKTKKSGEPIGLPGCLQIQTENSNEHDKAHAHLTAHVTAHHGLEARHTHLSVSFCILTYSVDMFIPQKSSFVNRKMIFPAKKDADR